MSNKYNSWLWLLAGMGISYTIYAYIQDPLIKMRGIINNYLSNPYTRVKIAEIANECQSSDSICEITTTFNYVSNGIKYMSDPTKGDGFFNPLETMQSGIGDCDCKSILLATLLESIGHKTRLVLVPGHVFVQVMIPFINTDDYTAIVSRFQSNVHYDLDLFCNNDNIVGNVWLSLEPTATNVNIGWIGSEDYAALATGNFRYG